MFDDWGILGSVISVGIIVTFIYVTRKPQYTFNKEIDHVHLRTIKRF